MQNPSAFVPPYDEQSEMAVLGALLLDGEALAVVLEILRPDDFYKRANRNIYQAIIDRYNRGESTDIITLVEELKAKDLLSESGGPAYVASLTAAVPTSANVEYYAKIVKDNSVRRTLIKISQQMMAWATDKAYDTRLSLENIEKEVFELTEAGTQFSIKPPKQLVSSTVEIIERWVKDKDSSIGIPTGFKDLDRMLTGFHESEFIVIGARPSVGKTALALSMATHIAIHKKIPVGFFTLEMSDMALMLRILAGEARINFNHIRAGLLKPADFQKISEAAGRIYEAPLYIVDVPNIRLLDLRAQARKMCLQYGVKVIFIDYLTLITSEDKAIPRHEQIAEISRSLKALARELSIPVIALSQLRRESEGKRPSLADIRESGSIEQDADVVIFIHRERLASDDNNKASEIETELIIAKQRNGPIGTVKVAFIPEYTKFESFASDV
ncbi:replicative DNA helicase [Spirochaetia bacterium 38H-sp]|uniref:Replicative DNA helicase n=1 Tax=Rarispira pelagica TaxID=3141764 RepID=A0ABU9UE14_9SPIR